MQFLLNYLHYNKHKMLPKRIVVPSSVVLFIYAAARALLSQ